MSKQIYNRFVVPTRRGRKTGSDLTAVIMSSSVEYRRRSSGPKLLFKSPDGQPLINTILENIVLRFNGADIIYTIGFQADKIIKNRPKYGRIVENQLYDTTNNIEECRLAINNSFGESLLIISGDMFFESFLLDCIDTKESCAIVDNCNKMPEDEIGLTEVHNYITTFSYGLSTKWCNIAYLKGKEFELFSKFCFDRENSKKFVWEGLNYVIDSGGQIKVKENIEAKIKKITGEQ